MQNHKRRIETLPNGLTILLNELRFYPAVIFDMWIRAGSRNESESEWGMAHFLEHMMFAGNAKYSKEEFYETLFAMGGDDNAGTYEDVTNYYILSTSGHFKKAFDLHHALITSPQFPIDEFHREREVVLEEIGIYEDDPADVVNEKVDNALFKGTGYAHPVIGNAKILAAMTPAMMRGWHAEKYSPDKMLIIITGDFDIDEVLPMIVKKYSGWNPPNNKTSVEPYKDVKQSETRIISETADIDASYISISFKAGKLKSMETYALDVLMEALGGSRSTRLNKRLLDDLNIVNELDSYSLSRMHAGILGIDVELTRHENIQPVLDEIFDIISDIAANGFSADEIGDAKIRLITDRIFSNEKIWDVSDFYGQNISLGSLEIADKYIDRTFSVTPEQVHAVAEKYLRPDNMAIGTNIPRDKTPINISFEKFRVGESKSEPPADFGVITRKFATSKSTGNVLGDVVHEKLSNGVELLYRHNPANPSVSIQLDTRCGLSHETRDTNGVVEVMQRAMWKGTVNKSMDELIGAFDRLGAQAETDADFDYLTNDGIFLSRDFSEGFKLLAEMTLEPSFPEHEIKKVKTDVLDAIIQSRDDTSEVSLLNLREVIYGADHPYGRHYLGDPDVVDGLTVDVVRNFHSQVYSPHNIVISIVGDVPFEAVRDAVYNTFANLPERAAAHPDIPGIKKPEGLNFTKIHREKSQVRITIGHPGPSITEPDYPAARLLDIVLGGTAYSRLFKIIRDNEGLAYDVYTDLERGLHNPLFLTSLGTAPENFNLAVEKIRDEYRKISSDGPTEDELNKARNWLRGHNLIWRQGNEILAGHLARNVCNGLPYDFDLQLLERYKKLTVADILDAARKYCNPDNLVISACGPVD